MSLTTFGFGKIDDDEISVAEDFQSKTQQSHIYRASCPPGLIPGYDPLVGRVLTSEKYLDAIHNECASYYMGNMMGSVKHSHLVVLRDAIAELRIMSSGRTKMYTHHDVTIGSANLRTVVTRRVVAIDEASAAETLLFLKAGSFRTSTTQVSQPCKEISVAEDATSKTQHFLVRRRKARKSVRTIPVAQSGRKIIKSCPKTNTADANERKRNFLNDSDKLIPRVLPKIERVTTRDERDDVQRASALKKEKLARRSIPKLDREAKIKSERDKRSPIFQSARLLQVGGTLAVAGLGALLGRFLTSASSAAAEADGLLKGFRELCSQVKKIAGKVLWILPIILTVHFAVSSFGFMQAGLGSVLLLGLSKVVKKDLWSVIENMFVHGPRLQSAFDLDATSRLLSTVMAFSIFGKKMGHNVVGEFMKRLAVLPRVAEGWKCFLEWSLQAIEVLLNSVRAMFGKDKLVLLKSNKSALHTWCSTVDAENIKANIEGFIPDDLTLDKYVSLGIEGKQLKDLYRGTPMSRTIDESTNKLVTMIRPFIGALNSRNNFRVEPEFCVFSGAPGIGKTNMLMPLCMCIMMYSGLPAEELTHERLLSNIFQKGSSDFWNGYSKPRCVVMDDAFQNKPDPTDKENEYSSIIKYISSWSMPLNFADLESKGKIYFLSELLVATTNATSIQHSAGLCVHEPSAVTRRIGHGYRMVLKSEYANGQGRLDYDKYKLECMRCKENGRGIDAHPWYIWELYRQDYLTGDISKEARDVKTVILEVAASLKNKRATHLEAKDHLKYMVDTAELQGGRNIGTLIDKVRPYVPSELDRAFGDYTSLVSRVSLFFGLALGAYLQFHVWKLAIGIFIKLLRTGFDLLGEFFGLFKRPFIREQRIKKQSNRPVTKAAVKVNVADIRLQSGDPNVPRKVYASTYKMSLTRLDNTTQIMGQITMVVDSLAMQPSHFTEELLSLKAEGLIENTTLLHFTSSVSKSFTFTRTLAEYLSFSRHIVQNTDVEFISFEGLRAHANVVKNYITEADIRYLRGVDARLDVCEIDDRRTIVAESYRSAYLTNATYSDAILRFSGKTLRRSWRYMAPTTAGDCGAPLCLLDNSRYSGRSAMGFHIAGSPRDGVAYSTVVTQEMIKSAMGTLEIVDDRYEEDLTSRGVGFQSGCVLPFESGSMLPLGRVSKGPVLCPISSYYKTNLYGSIGPYELSPAPLGAVWREGELVFPMVNAMKPYTSPVIFHDATECADAVWVAMRPLTIATKDSFRDILSYIEAVVGIEGIKYRSLPRDTSAGYPYVLTMKGGKKEFFGSGDKYDLSSDASRELEARVDHIISSARAGVRLSHTFVDFLKDELRPAAKVASVSTRLISSAPVDYVIAVRRLFGAFTIAAMTTCVDNGMGPGLCTFTDWTKLANKMHTHGDAVFAGDFKAFDSSLQPVMFWEILNFINQWYDDGPENARARRVLWLDLVHSRHVTGLGKDQTYICQWNKNMPSGHPLTAVVNSMYSLSMLVKCYHKITGDKTGYWSHVYSITNGDDNASNVSSTVKDVFNQVSVGHAMGIYGMHYTSDDKTSELIPYTSLSGITFLKRRFFLDKGWWNCPLDKDSFLYTHYWCKDARREKDTMVSVLENALEELSLHEEHEWTQYGSQIYEILKRFSPAPRRPCSRASYQALVRSREDSWY